MGEMDTELKEHLKRLEESHTGIEVRQNMEKLDEILAADFFAFERA